MKKSGIIIICFVCMVALWAQNRIFIHKTDRSVSTNTVITTDSLTFSNNAATMYFFKSDNSIISNTVTDIDSITFAEGSDTVKINYSGTTANVTNPFENNGVTVTQNGADIIITSTLSNCDVKYALSGTTTDGSVKIYSNNRFDLVLNGVNITNADGPAINIQSSKRIAVVLADGTQNSLTDGTIYTVSTEDQKGAFFSEGQLVFSGNGSLTVKGNNKYGICSDDYIEQTSGSITVTGAPKDGIHCKDYFRVGGGTLNVTAVGDAIEAEAGHVLISGGAITTTTTSASTKGITCDSTLTVSGGTINMTVGGNQSKGLKSGTSMTLSGGTITMNTTGAAVLEASGSGYNPSYCSGIKSGGVLALSGANINITSNGVGGKGISSDGNITMTAGTISVITTGAGATYTNSTAVLDSYSASGMDADGDINIIGGSLTTSCSGSGSKGISADGNLTFGDATHSPVVITTNTGTKLLVSGTANYTTAIYTDPKAIKCDGILTVNNGTFTIKTTQQGSEGIDGNGTININGGTFTFTIGGNQSKGLKSTGTMTLSGGNLTINTTGGVTLENVAAATYDPSYCAAIKSDGIININGSAITITANGIAAKGITSTGNINITSGTVNVTNSGAGATYKNSSNVTDSYSSSCITTDAALSIVGGTVICSASGSGGKAISTDGALTIGDATNSPTVTLTTTGAKFVVSGTDYCHPKTIVSTGAIIINNGNVLATSSDDGIHSETSITINGGSTTVANSYEGIESKYIYLKGGTTNVTATNDGWNATMSTVSGGTESDDNSLVSISGGTHFVNATNGDAIDSNGDITMTGGTVYANGPNSGVEEAADFNGVFNMNGGIFVGCGSNSNMTKAMSNTSSQPNMFITSNSTISSSTMMTLAIAGTGIVSFKPKYGAYKILISSPAMTKGSAYIVYTGGTNSGVNTNGLYSGGTFSNTGATSKKSGTLSSSATVNSISF